MQLWERVGKLAEKIGIKGAVGLYTNSLISSPLLIGFFRPCIMLPTTALSESDFENTILHELTHYKRRDMFYKWLVQGTICFHWFNPLVYLMGREVNRACELSCDEAVIKSMDMRKQRAYGDTLLNAMSTGGKYKDTLASVTLNESAELLKERLDSIMKFKRLSKAAILMTAVFTMFVIVGATYAGTYAIAAESGSIGFNQTIDNQQSQNAGIPVQRIVYENVEMRHYEGEDGHPYIHNTKTNKTTKEIVGYQYGVLAFDKDGNPLKIDWWSIDTEVNSTYFYLIETSVKILPSETYNVRGGWSLNFMGNDSLVANIAYVLYCDKEITFEDGTVWENPGFEGWRTTYEGKKIDVNVLENYYPYEQTITF